MAYSQAERECRRRWANQAYRNDPLYRLKQQVRCLVTKAVMRGKLKRGPCEVCGSEIVQGHHDDYGKPLEVRWLCRRHHRQWHDVHGEAKVPGVR